MSDKLKCFRCGKDIQHGEGWEVAIKPILQDDKQVKVAPAYFCLCNECRIIWTIAMGHWLEENGRKAKEVTENGETEKEVSSDNSNN